ncbi:hypothetical protein TNCV_447181 [Trichonephila clavipes]|nr:hypothetical protein TNCV_447181 [Trichonephila clavipes]
MPHRRGKAGKETHPRERGGEAGTGRHQIWWGGEQQDSNVVLRNAWKMSWVCSGFMGDVIPGGNSWVGTLLGSRNLEEEERCRAGG